MSTRAPEVGFDYPGADFRGLPENTFDTDEGVDMIGTDLPDSDLFREVDKPDIDIFGCLSILGLDQLMGGDR
jgi:hypothetical protein